MLDINDISFGDAIDAVAGAVVGSTADSKVDSNVDCTADSAVDCMVDDVVDDLITVADIDSAADASSVADNVKKKITEAGMAKDAVIRNNSSENTSTENTATGNTSSRDTSAGNAYSGYSATRNTAAQKTVTGFVSSGTESPPNIRDIRHSAMNLLARREHSRVELARKLHLRYSEYDLIESALNKLVSDGLLSDERFTEAYVNYRRRLGFGPVRIAAELRERGVGEVLAGRYLNQSERSWIEAALAAKNKKFGHEKAINIEERARQQRFLSYRGFRHCHFADI